MTMLGFNLNQVKDFNDKVSEVRKLLNTNINYMNDVINHGNNYNHIKEFFQKTCRYLQYIEKIHINDFYRVRINDTEQPFTSRKELIYPEPSLDHKDRMNNTKFRVLYVSLNEYTAMAETRINSTHINKKFQLTRFSTKNAISIYRLGIFSELYFNTPRDSIYSRDKIKKLFDSEISDSTIKGLSALECAIADILYDTSDNYHLLSSILADAIFSLNSNIDAIMYPSMQNKYGINLAIKKECADLLDITYSSLNELKEVYQNGFYKYYTKMQCEVFNDQNDFKFMKVEGNAIYR